MAVVWCRPDAEWMALNTMVKAKRLNEEAAQLVAEYLSNGELEPAFKGWAAWNGIDGYFDVSDIGGFLFSRMWQWRVGHVVAEEHMDQQQLLAIQAMRAYILRVRGITLPIAMGSSSEPIEVESSSESE
jgi:hypothetical protein